MTKSEVISGITQLNTASFMERNITLKICDMLSPKECERLENEVSATIANSLRDLLIALRG